MALKLAGAASTRGATVEVLDPTAATGSLFASYRRIPGVSGFNLPSNARTPTEIGQLGGTAQIAGDTDPGEIAVTYSALHRSHPAVELLYSEQDSSNVLQFRFRTLPLLAGTIEDAITIAAGSLDEALVASAMQQEFTRIAKDGMVFQHGTTMTVFKVVDYVEGSGAMLGRIVSFIFTPDAASAVTSAADVKLYVPGGEHIIRCRVLGMPKGDIQTDAAVAGEMSLGPETIVGMPTVLVA